MKNTIKSKARYYTCLGLICDEVLYRIEACEKDIERIREHGDEDDGGYWAGQIEDATEDKSHYETILSKLEKL